MGGISSTRLPPESKGPPRAAIPALHESPIAGAAAPAHSQSVLLFSPRTCDGEQLRQRLTRAGFQVTVLPVDEVEDWFSIVVAAPPGALVLDGSFSMDRAWDLVMRLKDHPATREIPLHAFTRSSPGLEETSAQIEHNLARYKNLGSESQRLVRKILAYIQEHYRASLAREQLAAIAGVSARHLTRCFRQELGLSPIAYLNEYRVEQARRILESCDMPVSEVAREVGFADDSSYFARVFRRKVGLGPRAYRRMKAGACPDD